MLKFIVISICLFLTLGIGLIYSPDQLDPAKTIAVKVAKVTYVDNVAEGQAIYVNANEGKLLMFIVPVQYQGRLKVHDELHVEVMERLVTKRRVYKPRFID